MGRGDDELKRSMTAFPASLSESPEPLDHLVNNHSPLAGEAKPPPLAMGKYSKTLEKECLGEAPL